MLVNQSRCFTIPDHFDTPSLFFIGVTLCRVTNNWHSSLFKRKVALCQQNHSRDFKIVLSFDFGFFFLATKSTIVIYSQPPDGCQVVGG